MEPVQPVGAVVIGPDHLDAFATNIGAGLREWGVESIVIDQNAVLNRARVTSAYGRYGTVVGEALRRMPRARQLLVGRPIEQQLSRCDPSLVICVSAEFGPEQIERWRALTPRATWVFWYPDHLANLGAHRVLLAPYDHLFFKEPFLVDLLATRTDLPVHLLADGCNPAHHRTTEPADDEERLRYQCDVAVAGNLYPYRLLVLRDLPERVDLRVYGNPHERPESGFDRVVEARTGEYVAGRTKALAFRGAKIALNTMHYAEIRGVNCRLFEATACGGFVLSHSGPDVERYFTPGTEIVTFDSPKEMAEAVEHYLHAPAERQSIASAGQKRAHDEHTFRHRVGDLLTTVGLATWLVPADPV